MRSTPDNDLPSCAPSGPGSNSRVSRSHAVRSSVAQITTTTSREREHIEHASLGGALLEVAHHICKATRGTAVARIDIVEHHSAGPATHAREHGDVLLAVRCPICDRLTE